MRALLLENIHPEAERLLGERGIEVRTVKGALDTQELVEALSQLSGDETFVALLEDEGLATIPTRLAERIQKVRIAAQ